MARALVFAESDELAAELLSLARTVGLAADAALLGPSAAAAAEARGQYGAERVFVCDAAALATVWAEGYADALASIVAHSGAEVVLLASTRRGKDLAGRLAQRLECGLVVDAIAVERQDGRIVVRRYGLGGNTVAVERIESSLQVIACLPHSFEASPAPTEAVVVPVSVELAEPRVKLVSRSPKVAAAVDVTRAERLVVVGKGLARQEDLAMIEELARLLGAEIGCTRALAADYHWLSEEQVIGISGKISRPKFLLSIGASGQIQHTVGILGAKTIVAINKDKGAPIFRTADYGIVGDLYEVVPRLIERLRQRT